MANDAKWYAGYLRIAYAESASVKMVFLEAADLIEDFSKDIEQVKRERDMAINELVRLEYPIPCESDELSGSEYCEEGCKFRNPQKECWLEYFRRCCEQEDEE